MHTSVACPHEGAIAANMAGWWTNCWMDGGQVKLIEFGAVSWLEQIINYIGKA